MKRVIAHCAWCDKPLEAVSLGGDVNPLVCTECPDEPGNEPAPKTGPPHAPTRHRLPQDRHSITKKFEVAGLGFDGRPKLYDGYLIVGFYPDGSPGELFVRFGKMGGRQGAIFDAFCTVVSIALQHGILLETLTSKFRGWGFEPRGMTSDSEVRSCTSPLDFIAQWLEMRFVNDD